MATGLLQITGEIDTAQFWPEGESDGDTIHVHVSADSFSFRPFPSAPFQSMTNDEIESAKALVEERSVEWIGGGVG